MEYTISGKPARTSRRVYGVPILRRFRGPCGEVSAVTGLKTAGWPPHHHDQVAVGDDRCTIFLCVSVIDFGPHLVGRKEGEKERVGKEGRKGEGRGGRGGRKG